MLSSFTCCLVAENDVRFGSYYCGPSALIEVISEIYLVSLGLSFSLPSVLPFLWLSGFPVGSFVRGRVRRASGKTVSIKKRFRTMKIEICKLAAIKEITQGKFTCLALEFETKSALDLDPCIFQVWLYGRGENVGLSVMQVNPDGSFVKSDFNRASFKHPVR